MTMDVGGLIPTGPIRYFFDPSQSRRSVRVRVAALAIGLDMRVQEGALRRGSYMTPHARAWASG